jgi:hypothetical protein
MLEEARQSRFFERERVPTTGLTLVQQPEARGQLLASRENLRLLMEERFGALPEELIQQIESIDDLKRLRSALLQVVHVKTLEELKL